MKRSVFLLFSLMLIGLLFVGCSSSQNIEEKESSKLSEKEKQKALEEEREELEKNRKEELGEFYVPLPPLGKEEEMKTVKAKALYLTGNVAGFKFQEENIKYYEDYINSINGKSGESADTSRLDDINKLEKALAIAKASEINAFVIDIKNDFGDVTWDSELEIVEQIGANTNVPFNDYQALFDYLDKNDIYKIARIVAFKDPLFAEENPENAIQLKEGGTYIDNSGETWVNPFDEYVWKYIVGLSREAALRGFDEIQYDYVRFPDRAAHYNPITKFPGREDRKKDEGIEDFLAFAKEELEAYNVHLAADVFGFITYSWDDIPEDIGQTWRKIANQVEYICPMIYPSHYGPGLYGFDVPDKHPYEVSKLAVMEAIERNAAQKSPAIIRPWFQGFTAPWVKGHIKYDAKAISDQMLAAYELGIEEYIIWSAGNNYDPMSFFFHDRIEKSPADENLDIMERTAEMTLDRFLKAQSREKYNALYLLTPIKDRKEDYDDFVEDIEKNNSVLNSYTINSVDKNENDEYIANINVSYTSDLGVFNDENAQYKVIRENQVFKVKTPEMKWSNKN